MNNLDNDLDRLSQTARAFINRDHGLLIDGKERSAGSKYEIIDPTSGQTVATAAEAGEGDVDEAVAAARRALKGPWARMRPNERQNCLLRMASLLEQHGQEISEIAAVESGRLLANTRGIDVDYSNHFLTYMAGWATKIEGKTMPLSMPYIPDGELDGFTFREPIGVVAAIVPWNVALGIAVWKIAPALAAGCTIVLKPAPQTPVATLRFAELALEAGVPEGVLNIITGSAPELGSALVRHPDVDKITFTGSTQTGRLIAQATAGSFKSVSMELGGKSPFLVMEDADLDRVIPAAAWGIFGNHGQNCCAGSRLFVHKRHYERVLEGVSEIAQNIRLGSPLVPETQMGPLANHRQRERVLGYIEAGRAQGARVVTGGNAPDHGGAYVEPTVLADVTADMTPVREEIFGPVLVAASFETDEEALRLANDTEYGLGASVWSQDLDRVRAMTRGLEAGSVWVNVHNALDMALPFGGWKNSGQGFDLGKESVLGHTRVKAVVHHYQ
jgi:phenylacetaldehyde dehydrogenase